MPAPAPYQLIDLNHVPTIPTLVPPTKRTTPLRAVPSRWHPPVALTAGRWMREHLDFCQLHAGTEFLITESVPDARRAGRRARLIVIGSDLAGRIRTPLTCSTGMIVLATVDPTDTTIFDQAVRIGAPYVVVFPAARPWLIGRLLTR